MRGAALFAVIWVIVTSITVVASAGPYEDGRAASARGDLAAAARLYRQAAEQGDARAETALGFALEQGRGIERNDQEAVRWYRSAVAHGSGLAATALAFMHAEGRGVEKSDREAAKLLRLAADHDIPLAQTALGDAYLHGRGVPQDRVSAHMWLNLAAAHGHPAATALRDELARRMSPAELIEAQRLARSWQPKGD